MISSFCVFLEYTYIALCLIITRVEAYISGTVPVSSQSYIYHIYYIFARADIKNYV